MKHKPARASPFLTPRPPRLPISHTVKSRVLAKPRSLPPVTSSSNVSRFLPLQPSPSTYRPLNNQARLVLRALRWPCPPALTPTHQTPSLFPRPHSDVTFLGALPTPPYLSSPLLLSLPLPIFLTLSCYFKTVPASSPDMIQSTVYTVYAFPH